VLGAAKAAGELLGKPTLARGLVAHAGVTAVWSAVLTLTGTRTARGGAVAGLAIAALDLGLIASRRYPAVRALPQVPQILDHVAFGVATALTLKAISPLRS
jgi:hypothetical protein